MRKIAVHEREDLKIFLEKPFEFPKSAEELYILWFTIDYKLKEINLIYIFANMKRM